MPSEVEVIEPKAIVEAEPEHEIIEVLDGKPLRNARGHFVAGHKNIGGRKPKAYEKKYYEITENNCSEGEWAKIVRRTVRDAIKGDWRAREWLSNRLMGMPTQRAALMIQSENAVYAEWMADLMGVEEEDGTMAYVGAEEEDI